MAIQEFDRPVRRIAQQSRWHLEYYLSLVLLVATLVFISYAILSLPGPTGHQPLTYRQLSEIPFR